MDTREEILELLAKKTELCDIRDVIAEKVLATSPLNDILEYSASLEALGDANRMRHAKIQSGGRNDNTSGTGGNVKGSSGGGSGSGANPNAAAAMKIVSFKVSTTPTFEFIAEPILETIKPVAAVTWAGENIRREIITVQVWEGLPLKVRVEKSSTVEDVIKAAIRQYIAESRTPALQQPIQLNSFSLRAAEDEGTSDLDPDLNPKLLIAKMGKSFILHRIQLDESRRQNNTCSLLIYLPKSEKTRLLLPLDTTIQQLLHRICTKRGYKVSDYHFKLPGFASAVRSDLTLGELGITEIEFCAN
eukprot:TRINITY_DN2831_c2_g1_i2.p1 TRINITY_DN2831_c2_g1~~TRINITY_DN2831_c2_g1_i2.p1  ORF type:complete len:303 (-),score=150.68 TRINITY_DN2831_c2_g1_i2:122-1030(-)